MINKRPWYLSFVFALYANTLCAQVYTSKEDCLSGNCKNGFGLSSVRTNRNPFPGAPDKYSSAGLNYNYLLMGTFVHGKLNGKGVKIELDWDTKKLSNVYTSKEKQLVNAFVRLTEQQKLLNPDTLRYEWVEQGIFKDNQLNGAGVRFVGSTYNLSTSHSTFPLKIYQGNFQDGVLGGAGVSAEYSGELLVKDSVTNKSIKKANYTIYHGQYQGDICMQCTMTKIDKDGTPYSMTGDAINTKFFSGWVVRNYKQTKVVPIKLYPVEPYRALFIGGREIYVMPGTEIATDLKEIVLDDNRTYLGEVDATGTPHGFGTIKSSTSYRLYQGMVDGDHPEGYGLYFSEGKNTNNSIGGFYRNNQLVYGAAYVWSSFYIEFGNSKNPNDKVDYLESIGEVINGPYHKWTYGGNHELVKEETGFKVNGKTITKYVSYGKTIEDIIRQRVVTDGKINFNEVVVGDVVVVDGLASPVESIGNLGSLKLQDGRTIQESYLVKQIQLSRHLLSEFTGKCTYCNGTPAKTIMYTPPPREVEVVSYRTEVVVGDYTVLTMRIPQTTRYIKTYAPEARTEYCQHCNFTGIQKITNQLKE